MIDTNTCLFCAHSQEEHVIQNPADDYKYCEVCGDYCEQEEYNKEGGDE